MEVRLLSNRIEELVNVQFPGMYNRLGRLFAIARQQEEGLASTTRAARTLEYVACL